LFHIWKSHWLILCWTNPLLMFSSASSADFHTLSLIHRDTDTDKTDLSFSLSLHRPAGLCGVCWGLAFIKVCCSLLSAAYLICHHCRPLSTIFIFSCKPKKKKSHHAMKYHAFNTIKFPLSHQCPDQHTAAIDCTTRFDKKSEVYYSRLL